MCSSWRWPNRFVSANDSPSIQGKASRRVTRSSGERRDRGGQPFIRPIDIVEDRTDRPPVAPRLEPGVDRIVVSEVARPRRRGCLAAVRGSLETGDRAIPPAEQMGGEVLEAPRPHRPGLGHPLDADLLDQVAPERAFALAEGDELGSMVDAERLRHARPPWRPSHRRRGTASRARSGPRGGRARGAAWPRSGPRSPRSGGRARSRRR